MLYTAHFLSRGGLTWVHNARVTGEALQILGDWASKAYMRYIDLDFDVMLVNIDFGFSCRNSTAYQRTRKSWGGKSRSTKRHAGGRFGSVGIPMLTPSYQGFP